MTVSHAILEKDTWGVDLELLCAVVLLFAITVPNTCTREYLNDFWVTVCQQQVKARFELTKLREQKQN